ncbi:hypothetical protein [Pelagibius marinus]|uniref:hypothetical protein n=1 Tax=Pelagibius marinus TaxID=2762760 RepID=UPI0018727A88|nr:hypothetical protein [Pelagibius marinus]
MKFFAALCIITALFGSNAAFAAAGAGGGPSDSWNEMQKFEYYLGDIAGALNVCRMYGMHAEMRELASLSPYGKIGMQAWAAYDDIRGGVCGRVRTAAESVLSDKDKVLDYLRAKYDCSSGECIER